MSQTFEEEKSEHAGVLHPSKPINHELDQRESRSMGTRGHNEVRCLRHSCIFLSFSSSNEENFALVWFEYQHGNESACCDWIGLLTILPCDSCRMKILPSQRYYKSKKGHF